jgi:hypothetical protein
VTFCSIAVCVSFVWHLLLLMRFCVTFCSWGQPGMAAAELRHLCSWQPAHSAPSLVPGTALTTVPHVQSTCTHLAGIVRTHALLTDAAWTCVLYAGVSALPVAASSACCGCACAPVLVPCPWLQVLLRMLKPTLRCKPCALQC